MPRTQRLIQETATACYNADQPHIIVILPFIDKGRKFPILGFQNDLPIFKNDLANVELCCLLILIGNQNSDHVTVFHFKAGADGN